jgi:NAD(P)-dependent dehydrogenase (short-subunit alcohol dehydrogenase family)
MSKVFLVTGSSRGLGRAIAEGILAAGHLVVATARKPAQLDDLVAKYGDQVLPVELDVTDYPAAQAAVRAAVDTFGRLDVVVNNAGYANLAAIEDITIEDFRAQVDTNFFGVVNVTKAALPVLRAQGSGHFVTVSSVGGRVTTPGLSAYQSSKWALGGFHGSLAQEVGALGIKVTVLEPGGMKTDWAGSSMSVPPISEPYEQTVGSFHRSVRTQPARVTSDIDKVAQVLLRVTELDEPPLRLMLGSDAVEFAERNARALAESDAKWHELSVSTDES